MSCYKKRIIVSSLIAISLLSGSSNPVFADEKGKVDSPNKRQASEKPLLAEKPTLFEKPTLDQMILYRANVDVAVMAFVKAHTQSKIARTALNDLEKRLQPELKIAIDDAIIVANSVSGKQRAKTRVNIETIKKTVIANFLLARPELVVAQDASLVADTNLSSAKEAVKVAQNALRTAFNLFGNKP